MRLTSLIGTDKIQKKCSFTFETPACLFLFVLKFLCAVPPNSPQHHNCTRADLQPRDKVALSTARKSRVDTGIELFVSLIFFITDREGEKCRPLDHMRQLPCINKAPLVPYTKINFYIYTKLFHIYFPCGIYIASWNIVHLQYTHELFQNSLFQRHFEVILYEFWHELVRDTARHC